jgi:hypothetical protein
MKKKRSITFTSLLSAWLYCRQAGIKRTPKRVSLHEWRI